MKANNREKNPRDTLKNISESKKLICKWDIQSIVGRAVLLSFFVHFNHRTLMYGLCNNHLNTSIFCQHIHLFCFIKNTFIAMRENYRDRTFLIIEKKKHIQFYYF